jgi:hypothetical protein
MKRSRILTWLSVLIALLAALAAGVGLIFQDGGSSFAFTTLRGQVVQIAGQGLYRYDSIATAAQARGQDVVTLFLGIPLLVFALWLARRGSLRGQVLLTGTLGYFLYTYMSMAFLAAYNPLFLVYVALFSSSLFAFVQALTSIDRHLLPAHFSAHLPRRSIAVFFFTVGGFLLLMWVGLIVPPLLEGHAPLALESTTTLVIQAMDLGILVPVAVMTGVLLLRRAPLGYLLASVLLIKFFTYGTAVTAMAVGELLAGVTLTAIVLVGFPLLTCTGIGLTIALLRNLSDAEPLHMPTPEAQQVPATVVR